MRGGAAPSWMEPSLKETGKPLAEMAETPCKIRRVIFVKYINYFHARCRRPLGAARYGGNLAETAEPPCRNLPGEILQSHPRSPDWHNACGNCGNCEECPLTYPPGARDSRAVPTNRRTTSSWMAAASTIWAIGTDSLAAWPCAPEPGPKLMISMPSSA